MSEWHTIEMRRLDQSAQESREAAARYTEDAWRSWEEWSRANPGAASVDDVNAAAARDFVMEDLTEVLFKNVSSGTAPCPADSVTYEAVKAGGLAVWTVILVLCNALLAGCAAPRAWLEVFIKWIYKKGDPDVWTNYRGIALASVILKIYERMLKNRWSRLYLKILRPISWLQDEGADGVDCRHQLWLLQETLAYRLFVLGLNTFCITVDLARAFPSSMREYVALMMWNVGCRGAFLRALWNIWNRVGVRLATSDGCYSDFVAFVRGLLEGRVMSGDGFAVLLDDLRRVLEASGLGVRLVRRDGTEIWVGCVLKTDDVLLMADSEDELRLAYGILKAWAFQFRFDLSYQKHELLRTCLVGDSWAGRTVHWRWAPGELAPYVQSRPRLAEYDLAPETYTYKSSVLYLGCLVDESLDADVSVQSRLQTKAWPIVESTEASVASVSVLQRADALAVTNALFRGAMEYPCGPIALLSGEDDEGGLSAKVDKAYAAALVFVLGDVATHMPADALLALTGQESLASRRRAGRANFLRALEAVSVGGHRAVVLDIFRSSVSPRFVDASITHAVDGAAAALGLPPRERSLRLSKNE